jgi:excisionase family DNA binding protein
MTPQLSITQVARLLSVHPRTVTRWVKRGQFPPPYRTGGTLRWDSSTLRAWLKKRLDMQ